MPEDSSVNLDSVRVRGERKFIPRGTNSLSSLGKLPPQALDLEEAVLGALMIEKDALTAVVDILKPEVFYKEAHQIIFSVIRTLFQRTEPTDILTVTAELRKQGNLEMVGGAYYITELTNRVASSANIEFHARIISQKFIQRELIKISSEIINQAYEDTTDVFDLLDQAEKKLFDVTENNLKRGSETLSDLIKKSVDELKKKESDPDGATGVKSGFHGLDQVTGGWQKSDLIIIAARPGMGKTAFALSCARNAAVDFRKPVALFSLEMSSVQLVNRLISAEAELDSNKLRRGKLERHEWQQLHHKIGRLSEAPIYIDDTPALSIFDLRAKTRRLKAQFDIELIIVDYLQLMRGTQENKMGNREQEIGTISRSLKAIAKELQVPVIALSQLSRKVEERGGAKRPILSDLRESGSIEQDADLVLFLNRPEYHGLTQDETGQSTAGLAEVIIAKHRNGSLEDVKLNFISRFVKYVDLENPAMSPDLKPFPTLSPSTDFDSRPSNIIIRPSKMNDLDDESPF